MHDNYIQGSYCNVLEAVPGVCVTVNDTLRSLEPLIMITHTLPGSVSTAV